MVKVVSDIYKKHKDYNRTLEFIKFLNEDKDDLINEWKNILKYIEKLYISYDNKNREIKNYKKDIIIKNGIDNSNEYLIDIYIQIYKDYNIDIDLMLLLIIPSISIKMNNGIDIIDFNIGSHFNNRILNLVNEEDFLNEKCSICLENIYKNPNIIYIKSCKHVFHRDCLFKWYKVKLQCPCCRKQLF
jgi:hypothetical protein